MNQQNIEIEDVPLEQLGFNTILKNFLVGGVSGMIATTIIQPADMLKTRIQLASEQKLNISPAFIFSKIINNEGFRGFYVGLDSALLRQFIYCGMRLGIFYNLSDRIKFNNKQRGAKEVNLSVFQKTYCSLVAGVVSSGFCTPCSLILTRMQADATLPPPFRRNYKNVFQAFYEITRKEGLLKLWTGGQITMLRACAMNAGMLVTYEEGKERLVGLFSEGMTPQNQGRIQRLASLLAALVIGVGSLPFDNVKTKLQKQYRDKRGYSQYSGIADCFAQTIKKEGIFKLWVGLPSYYLRVGPHALITLQAAEFLKQNTKD